MLQAGEVIAFAASADLRRARPGYTVLGWRVADIAATARGLAGRGVEFLRHDGMDQDENGAWTTPGGDKVAWFADPDGNVLSLTQFT
jgi:hypothetical protein